MDDVTCVGPALVKIMDDEGASLLRIEEDKVTWVEASLLEMDDEVTSAEGSLVKTEGGEVACVGATLLRIEEVEVAWVDASVLRITDEGAWVDASLVEMVDDEGV